MCLNRDSFIIFIEHIELDAIMCQAFFITLEWSGGTVWKIEIEINQSMEQVIHIIPMLMGAQVHKYPKKWWRTFARVSFPPPLPTPISPFQRFHFLPTRTFKELKRNRQREINLAIDVTTCQYYQFYRYFLYKYLKDLRLRWKLSYKIWHYTPSTENRVEFQISI